MKQFDKFVKFGEPLMFFLVGILLALSIGSSIEPVRLGLRLYIIPIAIVLFVLATIGFVLNSRKIKLDAVQREADFEALKARHAKIFKDAGIKQ